MILEVFTKELKLIKETQITLAKRFNNSKRHISLSSQPLQNKDLDPIFIISLQYCLVREARILAATLKPEPK